MERIQAFINKLKEQLEQNADVAQMLVTVQLLQSELTQLQRIIYKDSWHCQSSGCVANSMYDA